jgi:hypothetical protein
MAERFLCSDPMAGDMSFADVEEILDALEAALVSADTPLFDAARQSWQPVALHPEVRSAWESRARYRPPGSTALALPTLPAPSAVEVDDLTLRRAAYARVRSAPRFENAEDASTRQRRFVALVLLCGLLLLAVVGWAVVTFAVRLTTFAAGLFALSGKR